MSCHYSITRLNLTQKENMWLLGSSEAVDSIHVKLETSRTVILPPNGECSMYKLSFSSSR